MTSTSPPTSTRLLTSAQTAAFLRCKPQTLRKWRVRGCGPQYIRLGDSRAAPVAYRLSDLETWIAERVYTSTTKETVRETAAR